MKYNGLLVNSMFSERRRLSSTVLESAERILLLLPLWIKEISARCSKWAERSIE